MHKIEINKHIPPERWGEFFEMFSHGNKGRIIEMELVGPEQGDQNLVESVPLAAIALQPTESGDDLIIYTHDRSTTHTHTVNSPIDVWTGQDENGIVMAMDITDQQGNHMIVKLAEVEGS